MAGKIIKGSAITEMVTKKFSWEDAQKAKLDKREKIIRECLAEADRGLVVLFTKLDGTRRNLRGTTKESLIPVDQHPKNTGRKQAEGTINIYDLDKGEWRSFKVESVEHVTVL